MNRPQSRNQSAYNIGHGRGKGRGRGRGRGQGSGPRNSHATQPYVPVPPSSQVLPGAGVSIVLKVDQPTGRQVQGIVAEVLGRGDHPRGIKVRLVDGRVGRVQAIVDVNAAKAASAGLEGLGRNGDADGQGSAHVKVLRNEWRRQDEDMREDGYDYESVEGTRKGPSLMDYVKVKPNARSKKYKTPIEASGEVNDEATGSLALQPTGTITCPICSEFEGDEEAVAFHVNQHFD